MSLLPPGWTVQTSRSSGTRYFFSESKKKSIWCDDSLPPGWGFVREGEHSPKLFYHLATGKTTAEVPPAEHATAAASAGASGPAAAIDRKRALLSSDEPEEHSSKASRTEGVGDGSTGRVVETGGGGSSGGTNNSSGSSGGTNKSSGSSGGTSNSSGSSGGTSNSSGSSGGTSNSSGSSGGASSSSSSSSSGVVGAETIGGSIAASAPAALESPLLPHAHDASRGDSPLLALARQEWLSWHHRKLTAAVAAHWPLAGDSKSLRACRSDGLLPGLQGMHARLLFGQRDAQVVAVDALVPYAPNVPDKDTIQELVGSGLKEEVAGPLVARLCVEMSKAATNLGVLYQELVAQADAAGAGSALPLHGTVSLIPLQARAPHLPAQLLVVYEPSPDMARKYLQPVRASASLPTTPLYGPLTIPLYTASAGAGVAAALGAAGLAPSPFTAVLPLNATHFHKLVMLYRLAAAGVTDPAQLPAVGAAGCLHAATLAPTGPESTASCTPERTTFLRRLFCVLARYEAFSGNSGGIQGAMPHHVFDGLEGACGVSEECFASPLNCHFPRFCSAFPDTDAPFGSRGSFFEAAPTQGAFQANPPFVNSVMKAMALRLHVLLDAAKGAGQALLYFVIVPSWTDAYFHTLLVDSPFKCASDRLVRKGHEFIDGLQHRAGRCTWGANVDSTWFLLATPAAVALHGLSAASSTAHINNTFAQTTESLGEERRVFKYK